MNVFGTRVQTNVNLVDRNQYRFPRSKGIRIKRKWQKDDRNWRSVPSKKILYMKLDNVVICHPSLLPALKKAIGLDNGRTGFLRKPPAFEEAERNFKYQTPFGMRMPHLRGNFGILNTGIC